MLITNHSVTKQVISKSVNLTAQEMAHEGDVLGDNSGDAASLERGTLSRELPLQSGTETVGGAQRKGRKRTGQTSEANHPANKKGRGNKDKVYRERQKGAQQEVKEENNELKAQIEKLKSEKARLTSDNASLEKKVMILENRVGTLESELKVSKMELACERRVSTLQTELSQVRNERENLQRDLEIAKQNPLALADLLPFPNIPMAQSGQDPFHNQLAQPEQLQFHNPLAQHESQSSISVTLPRIEQRCIPKTIQQEEAVLNSNSSSTMLPLGSEPKLEQSAYCKEVSRKYEELDDGLKLCLISFAVFPENAEVKTKLLKYWWVGKAITEPDGMEEKFADETLKKFVEMEFIEPVNKKHRLSTKSYRMYPFVRSAVINQARKEEFLVYDHDRHPTMDFSKCYKAYLAKTVEESKFIELGKLEKLFGEQVPVFKEKHFSKLKRITVLSLERLEGSTDRQVEGESTINFKGLSKLKNLRFLSLQGISGIKTLPNSLSAKLRIIYLRGCPNLEDLPRDIGSLKKLTYLDISECDLLEHMPKGLSSLSELKVFKGFVITDDLKSCSLDDLAALKKLEKLSITIMQKYYLPKQLGTAIPKFENLRKLKIAWGRAKLTAGEEEEESEELSSREKPTDAGKKRKSGEIAKKLARRENKKKDSDAVQSTVSMGNTQNEIKLDMERGMKIAGAQMGDLGKDNPKPLGIELSKESVNAVRATRLSMQKSWSVVELKLHCYPETTPPSWLAPEFLHRLEKLYIKGGRLHNLPTRGTKWTVKILRLKYLSDLNTDLKELREIFPDLEKLEKVKCPKVRSSD